MNDRELYRLMELIPEAYTEETADFLKIHSADDCMAKPAPVIRKNTQGLQNNILWRILLPTGAAACLAVLVFAGIRTGLHEKPVTESSSVPEMTAVAAQTGTTSAETSRTEAAVLYTEAVKQTVVRQERTAPVQSGTTAVTATESRQSADSEQTVARTAAAQEKATEPAATAEPAPQPDPRYQPGDVNMDGTVDLSDAQILYKEYVAVVIEGGESILTPQQIALGDVYPNTKDDNLDVYLARLHGITRPEGIIMTDYLISYQDFTLIMDYHTYSVAGFDMGGMNVLEYAAYLGLPPEEPELRYAGETVTMRGDSLSKDSVTVRSLGSFPVSTERWEMTYASVESCGDFTIMYDGKGDLAGRGVTLYGRISQGKRHTDEYSEDWERSAADGGMEKHAVGDTAVYLDRDSYGTSSRRNKEASCYDTIALEWRNGDYLISVSTHSQEPFETYPDEILEQIIADFVVIPAK